MLRDHNYSSLLLAFCGSRRVATATAVERAKYANDLIVAMSGYKRHHMELKSECNGSPSNTGKFAKQGGGEENGSMLSANEHGSMLVRVSSIINKSPKSIANRKVRMEAIRQGVVFPFAKIKRAEIGFQVIRCLEMTSALHISMRSTLNMMTVHSIGPPITPRSVLTRR